MGVVFRAHSVCGEPRIQHNANLRLQEHPSFFTRNRTDCTFFLWSLHLARPSHPGHNTILLWSESPSGMCTKLHNVAASNNIDYPTRSLYYCLFAPHIY